MSARVKVFGDQTGARQANTKRLTSVQYVSVFALHQTQQLNTVGNDEAATT